MVFSGVVDAVDPHSGQPIRPCLIAARVTAEAFAAIEHVPSLKAKADFCFQWMGSINELDKLHSPEDRRRFLLNLICFAACIEGLFFFAAFAYVYFLRS